MSVLVQIGTLTDGKLDIRNIYELSQDVLTDITTNGVFFKVPEENLDMWNDYVDQHWADMDDYYYHGFEIPQVNSSEWFGYYNTYLYRLPALIKSLTHSLNEAKDFSSKVAYMN